MLPSRSLVRSGLPRAAARSARTPKTYRFQSTASSSSSNGQSGSSHLSAGVAGGVAAATVLYGIYYFSPSGRTSRTVNKTVKEANRKYQEAAKKLQESTPDADQTINNIRQFCYSYISWVPGGRHYVDAVFKDIELVRRNHREEADQLLNDAYKQFQELSKSGLRLETASKAAEVLADLSKKIGSLAGDAFTDVVDNHPELKQKFGGSIDKLKTMGDQYGPEAKKQVDETWHQVQDILGGGLSSENLDKVRKLVEEKVEHVKKLGDETWKKGLDQAKPFLDKNPKVKELVEKNASDLKQGNAHEVFDKAKSAVESGDTGSFEDYINKVLQKAKSEGSKLSNSFGLDQYFDMFPNGSEVLAKLKQMMEVAEKHTDEGEQLLKETMQELKQVLEKKSQKAQEILNGMKNESG